MSWSTNIIALVCALPLAPLAASLLGGAALPISEAWADSPPGPDLEGLEEPTLETEPEVIEIHGRDEAGINHLVGAGTTHAAAGQALNRSAFATVVRVDDAEGETRTLSEVLARTVGVNAQSLGGLGAFSSVSVRGADAGHTSVIVDGVPISRIASVAADLSHFDLGSFDEVELYRGGVPPQLGGAGVGGALQLRSALGPGANGKSFLLQAGLGSFGARRLRARWLGGQRLGPRAYHVSVAYSGADGDFDYFDDGATPLNLDDDQVSRRKNNGFDRIGFLARARLGSLRLGSRSSLQNQGLPGDAHNQAESAGLNTLHQLVDVAWEKPDLVGSSSLLSLRGYGSIERQHYSDPMDEIGLLGQDAVYRTTSLGGGTSLQLPIGDAFGLVTDLSGRLDWFRDTPQGASVLPPSAGNRQSLSLASSASAVGLGSRLFGELGVRIDGLRTRPSRDVFDPGMDDSAPARSDLFVSPRVSARHMLGQSFAIKGSVGRYVRIPTLLEMFGDRGFLLGNPDLDPETGVSGDVGFVWAPAGTKGPTDRIYVEAAAFASQPDSPIVFVNRNGLVAQAVNLDGAQIFGTELVGSVRVGKRATLSSNYSLMHTRNLSSGAVAGKQLPGRPRHRLYARIDSAFRPQGRLVVIWSDAMRMSGNFIDELNIVELPARVLVGAGLKVELVSDLLLGLEVKNAAGLRTEVVSLEPAPRPDLERIPKALSDVHGYPLPGRSLYLNLQWQH